MSVKDTVRALLDRLPDDCTIDDVIERLLLESAACDEAKMPPLTQAQREEIDRRLKLLERDPGPLVSWEEFRRELEQDE